MLPPPLLLALAVGAAALQVGVAALVLVAAPRRRANLALAAFLTLQGVQVGLSGWRGGWRDAALAYNGALYNTSLLIAIDLAYLHFLSSALDTPLVRPLRSRAGRSLLWGGSALVVAPFLWPRAFFPTLVPTAEGGWFADGAWPRILVAAADFAVLLFALACTVSAFRRAPVGSIAKARALRYAWAFVIQDAGIALAYVIEFSVVDAFVGATAEVLVVPMALATSAVILAWAMVRWQLFDVELRLKWTLRQSTVAAAFVAVFFGVSEAASAFFGETTGSTYVGIAAAAALVFALAPLQRFAERVSDAAMPRVQATPAYLAYKKLEVYRAALESALEEGGISPRERAILDRLRAKLDVAAEDAAALEREMGARPPGADQPQL